jgi:hypothetical protein
MNDDHAELITCIGCGCDDLDACETPDGCCHWLRADQSCGSGVCSRCPSHVARFDAGDRSRWFECDAALEDEERSERSIILPGDDEYGETWDEIAARHAR